MRARNAEEEMGFSSSAEMFDVRQLRVVKHPDDAVTFAPVLCAIFPIHII
jgi:hypothetical protein